MDLQKRYISKSEKEIERKRKSEIEIIFDKEAFKHYLKLKEYVEKKKSSSKKPTYSQLLKSLEKVLDKLKQNPYSGDLIPRKYIPKETISSYGTDKLFRIELVGYWRLIYTLVGDEIRIIVFVLEFMDHDDYNKRFNYRGKK